VKTGRNDKYVTEPEPWQYLNPKDVPDQWDWRNVSGVNYMSWTVN